MNMRIIFLISFLSLGCLPLLADAASFDCSKATNAIEKAICNTPELSQLDEKLASSYHQALNQLPQQERAFLTRDQKNWLVFVKKTCTQTKSSALVECLEEKYQERSKDLGMAIYPSGPYLFSQVNSYKAYKGTDRGCSLVQYQSSYPRIISPLSPKAVRWNEVLESEAKMIESDDECFGESSSGYSIKAATEDFISVDAYLSWPNAGGATQQSAYTINYVLTPALHPLEPNDIFTVNSGWQKVLQEIVWKEHPEKIHESGNGEGQPISVSFSNCGFSTQGIEITFFDWPNHKSILIPWEKLQSVLRTDSPIVNQLRALKK